MPATSALRADATGWVAESRLPGLVTLIARGDDVRVEAVGATAFDAAAPPMRRDTVFRIASMTKPVLAAATMMLVEDGLLAVDEPVDRLLPELARPRVLARVDGRLDDTVPARRPITVEDLLTFRMGAGFVVGPTLNPPYPIVRAGEELRLALAQPDPRTPHHPDEWVRIFGTLPLMHQPGELWQYNTPSLVLGVLVARAAGRPLDAVLAERVFAPLGMADTGFHLPVEQAHRLPPCFLGDPVTGRPQEMSTSGPEVWTRPPVFPSGAGGLLSTADDFLAFARLLLNGGVHRGERLLSESSVAALTTNHLTPAQIDGGGVLLSGHGWGYGMAVAVRPDDVSDVPGRYGWSGGYGTTWFNDPHEGLVAICLTQVGDFLWDGGVTTFDSLAYR